MRKDRGRLLQRWSWHLFVVVLVLFTLLLPVTSFAKSTSSKPELSTKKMYFFVNGQATITLNNVGKKKVTWRSTNKSIATVSKKGKVTAKGEGKCFVTATCNKKTYKCKIIVLSNEKFLKAYCKDIAAQIKKENKSPYDRVIMAAIFVSGSLSYGSSYDAFDALAKGQGTCVSGNRLLVEILNTMGYLAELRFAAKDDMSRYPSNVIFYSNHHNVKVRIKGKTYYVDGTPGGLCVYLSSKKKPLFCASAALGSWQVLLDNVPGHKKN